SLAELRSLDLSQTQITSQALEMLASLPKLERLSLWRVKRIDDSAASHLAAMRHLAVLDLAETPVTDKTLAALQSNKTLRKLYLRGSEATTAGVDALRRASPQCEVSQ